MVQYAEELWETLQFDGMICNASWPNVDSNYLHQNMLKYQFKSMVK